MSENAELERQMDERIKRRRERDAVEALAAQIYAVSMGSTSRYQEPKALTKRCIQEALEFFQNKEEAMNEVLPLLSCKKVGA